MSGHEQVNSDVDVEDGQGHRMGKCKRWMAPAQQHQCPLIDRSRRKTDGMKLVNGVWEKINSPVKGLANVLSHLSQTV